MRISHLKTLGLLTFIAFAMGPNWVGGRARAAEPNGSNEEYKRIVGDAVHEYDLEHWSTAIELFQKAYEIKPNARTLRGMGLAAFEDQRYVDAVRWLSEALEHPAQPLTGPMRNEIKPVLARALERVGSYALNNEPAHITLEIDGRPAYIQDGKLKVDPGERKLVATAEGFEPLSRSLNVRGGDNGVLGITLEPVVVSSAPFSPPVAAVEPKKVKDTSPTDSSRSVVLPWALIGGGGATAAAGGVLIGLMARDFYAVKNMEGLYAPEQKADREAAKKRVPLFSGVGFALAGVGVVSAAVGIALLVSHDARGEKTASFTETKKPTASRGLEVQFGLTSLSVRGGF
jgi:hypothetical protein